MIIQDTELLRRAVRDALYARAGTALPARGIRRRVATELDFAVTDEDVAAACEFWRDLGHLTFDFDEAGSTRWWRITAAGMLAVERD